MNLTQSATHDDMEDDGDAETAERRIGEDRVSEDFVEKDEKKKNLQCSDRAAKYKGVQWVPAEQVYWAVTLHKGKIYDLGKYKLAFEAAMRFDKFARKKHLDTNFKEKGQDGSAPLPSKVKSYLFNELIHGQAQVAFFI